MGKVEIIGDAWSLLWQLYFSPTTLFGIGGFLGGALMLSSPDPRVALIPYFVVLFILWGVLFSAMAILAFRVRHET